MTNEGQLPMMKNMLNSAMKAGYDMSQFHCYVLTSKQEAASYGTPEFKSITIRKLEVIRDNMKKDPEVIWIDNDIVLFKNVVNELRSHPGEFVMQDDLWGPCTGFFLARGSVLSIGKIQKSIQWLATKQGQQVNDQHAFHASLRTLPFVTVTLLDREEFPNGEIYFNQKKTSKAKMVHCNYLVTTAEKVQRFKDHNLWDESDTAFEKVNVYYI